MHRTFLCQGLAILTSAALVTASWRLAADEKAGAAKESVPPVADAKLREGRFGQALDGALGGYVAPADPQYARLPLTVEFWG
jgi:hypothetical protein